MKSKTDYLKEYLVKIGWDFDNKSIKLADETTNNFLTRLGKRIQGTQELWGLASKFAIASITEITKSTIQLLDSTAQASEQVDKLAKRYWTTSNNWRAFSAALDTLGISYEDLFWTTEEELNKFRELYAYGKSLEPPAALEETLKDIRGIRQEFNKLKVLSQYFFRALSYYIGEDTKEEIKYWKNTLQNIVKVISEKMPDAARKLGRALSLVLRFVSVIGRRVQAIYNVVKPIIDWVADLPGQVKLVGSIMGLVLLGPLGQIIAALTMIMLLIEDYMYWKAGKHSALDWSKFDSGIGELKDKFDSAKESISSIKEKISELFGLLGIETKFSALDVLKTILDAISWTVEQISNGLQNIVDLVDTLQGKKTFSEFSGDFTKRVMGNKEGGFIDKLIDWGFGKLGIERKDIGIPSIDEQSLVSSGILGAANSVKKVANNIVVNSNDTFNVNSVDEAASLVEYNAQRIVKSINTGLSPAFE